MSLDVVRPRRSRVGLFRSIGGHLSKSRKNSSRYFFKPRLDRLEARRLLTCDAGDELTGYSIPDGYGATIQCKSDLIAAYAPVLRMAAGDPFVPKEVAIFMHDARLVDGSGNALADLDETWLSRLNGPDYSSSDFFIDLPGVTPDDGRTTYSNIQSQYENTIYATVVEPVAPENELVVEYWFPYYQSDWQEFGGYNVHEGDWEGMMVFFGQTGPTRAAFAQHLAGYSMDWEEVETRALGSQTTPTHPVAYVALGAHSTYGEPRTTSVGLFGIAGIDQHRGDGLVLRPGDNLAVETIPHGLVVPTASDLGWLDFAGHWGQQDFDNTCSDIDAVKNTCGDNGPLGPKFADLRWNDPWGWADSIGQHSRTVGVSDGSQLAAGEWTVIVHGLSAVAYDDLVATGSPGGWMKLLAEKLDIESGNVAFHRMNAAGGATLEDWVLPGETRASNGAWVNSNIGLNDQGYHHVFAFDWAEVSNYATGLGIFSTFESPSGNAQGDDGYAEGSADVLLALAHGLGFADQLHAVVGYSRGAVVASEFVQRLLLDGNAATTVEQVIFLDAEGGGPIYSDNAFYAWAGVTTDNYFSSAPDLPGGHTVTGARNFDDGWEYAHVNFPSYLIGDRSPANGQYDGLILRDGLIVTKDTPRQAVIATTNPYQTDPPQTLGLFNGDFEFESTAGWLYHGGGGYGRIEEVGGNHVLVLDASAPHRTHNWLAMPPLARSLAFSVRRTNTSADDRLRVSIGNVILGELSLAATDTSLVPGLLSVPSELRGTTSLLSFEIVSYAGPVDSQVYLDDILFSLADPDPVGAVIVGGPYAVAEGGEIELQAASSRDSTSSHSDVEFWWDLDGDGVFGETTIFAERGVERGARPKFHPKGTDDGPTTVTIALRAFVDDVASASVTTTVSIVNSPPVVKILGPATANAGNPVTYSALVTDFGLSDSLSSITWFARVDGQSFSHTGSSFTITPLTSGKFDVSATVRDDDGGVTTAVKAINLPSPVSAPLDVVIAGRLDTGNESKLYSFIGEAGRTVTVTAYWGSELQAADGGLDQTGQFRLIGSDAAVLSSPANEFTTVFTNQRDRRYSRLIEYVLPADGTYFVEVSGSVGNFWLGISDPLAHFQPLSHSQPTEAAFGVRGDVQEWEFEATANQPLAWAYEGKTIKSWKILDPFGQPAGSGVGGSLTPIVFVPNASGLHRLIFEDAEKNQSVDSAGHIGPHSYRLTPHVSAPLDAMFTGRLDTGNESKLYSFIGEAGRTVTVTAYWGSELQAADGGLDQTGQFRLIGSDAAVLSSPANEFTTVFTNQRDRRYSRLIEYVLPADGTYFVEVSGSVGNFWLGISDPRVHVAALTTAAPTMAQFGVQGDVQEWEFPATAGQALAWDYSSTRAMKNWRIIDANNGLVASGAGGGTSQRIAFTPSSSGLHRLTFEDVKSAPTSAGSIGPFNYTLTFALPLLEITPDGIASNANPLAFTFQFSKVVTGFVVGDVSLVNGSAGTFTAVDGDTYTLRVTPTSDGPVMVSVPANAAADAGGNGNTSDSATVISDRISPALTITPNSTVTPASPIQFTVQFTEPVTGFEMGDISLTNGSVTAFTAIDGDTYEVQVAPTTDGVVTIGVAADAASDAAGNKNSGGSASVTSDRTVPTVTINQAAGQVDPTIVEPIHFTVVFSEPVSGFTDTDVTLTGTAVGPFTVVVTGTGPTYDVAVSGMSGGGTVIASINAHIAFDAAGNGNSASTSTDNVVLFDANKPPAITSPAAVSVPENSTTVMTVTATDADLPPQSIAFSIIGGADQDKFTISGDGVLKFKAAPDFESPTDADGNNVYVVDVKADDGNGGTAT